MNERKQMKFKLLTSHVHTQLISALQYRCMNRIRSPNTGMIPDYWYWCRESPGSMLVLRKLHHVSRQVTQLEVGEAVVPEVLQQPAAARRHHVRAAVAGPGWWEELAAGVEEAGRPTSVPVLSLGPGSCGDVASAPICQATWKVTQQVSESCPGHLQSKRVQQH